MQTPSPMPQVDIDLLDRTGEIVIAVFVVVLIVLGIAGAIKNKIKRRRRR